MHLKTESGESMDPPHKCGTPNGVVRRIRRGWKFMVAGAFDWGVVLMLAMVIFAARPAWAATFAVTGDTADYELDQSGATGNASGATLRCGATSATTPGGRNVIYIFALPVIGTTNQVESATLNFTYASLSGSPAFNGDLWGIGFYPNNSVITNAFVMADTDTNTADVKLHNNILTPSATTGLITSSNFAAYLQGFYATNSNYAGGNFVFLRVNPDANTGNIIVGYNLDSANSASAPVLNIVATNSTTLAAPANVAAMTTNGQIILAWSPVSGATSYNLKRGVISGGSYTVTNSTTATNFTDSGVAPGTTYYYVVSAANAGGESADSAEVSAGVFNFVHPGLLHAQADIDRMRQMVLQGVEPWASAFAKLTNDPLSQADYTIQWQPTTNFYTMGRNPDVNKGQVEADCSAAYQLALEWCITSNTVYAQKAVQILNDWSSSLTNISGSDAILAAGLDGQKFLNAAELLRYSNAGWAATNIAQFSAMMTNVFYPVISNFATFANGNWDGGCEKTMLGMGIFCERPDLFSRATNYFYTGTGAGALTNYIYANGQIQESGRDQQHAQLGIGQLAEVCEMAWHQGADLYGACSNRLLAGFEYTAKYNLGYSVPYTPASFTGWSNGLWFSTVIATNYRGQFRPLYEMVYNHYANVRGISAPFTAFVATNIVAPEGPWSYADDPGFGTLTCALQARPARANKISAATMSASSGVWLASNTEGDTSVAGITAGDYSGYNNINFTGVKSFSARITSSAFAGTIELHLDTPTGTLLGICAVPITDGSQFWATTSCNLAPASGTHSLFLMYQSNTNAVVFSHSWFALDTNSVSPVVGSNLVVRATNTLTVVNPGGQPLGQAIYGGEFVTNNAPAAGFLVGTNQVIWVSTNLSGNILYATQAVIVVGMADTPGGLTAVPGDGQVALRWNAATNASLYNLNQSLAGGGPYTNIALAIIGTNFVATNLINGTLYFFTVNSTNVVSVSTNSPLVSARPTSQSAPVLAVQSGTGGLQLNWPPDHTGWRLLVQTDAPAAGLGTNWVAVNGSNSTNGWLMPVNAMNGMVLYRLAYP